MEMEVLMRLSTTIAYVGAFRLPDGNAAAHRVLANARVFRELGHRVVFVETGPGIDSALPPMSEVDGFTVLRVASSAGVWDKIRRAAGHREVFACLNRLNNLRAVIAYNYPSLALMKLQRYCGVRGVKCLADVTEWYAPQKTSMSGVLKFFDSEYRMRVLHKKLDGLIVISRFLVEYYRPSVEILQLPPLVDSTDPKWPKRQGRRHASVTFIYAGSASASKERLDLILHAFQCLHRDETPRLEVYGLTTEEYMRLYANASPLVPADVVTFYGRVEHKQVLQALARADFALIIRDSTRLTLAGFPTKFVEAVTMGVPVITTEHPDLDRYVDRQGCGRSTSTEGLLATIRAAASDNAGGVVDRTLFDYRLYVEHTRLFFERLRM